MAPFLETRNASRQRIAGANCRWQRVLDVGVSAPIDEVKLAFRRLALLHHPDKGGDADTFKRVQEAYEEGLRRCRLRPLKHTKAKAAKATKAAKAAQGGRARRPRGRPPTRAGPGGSGERPRRATAAAGPRGHGRPRRGAAEARGGAGATPGSRTKRPRAPAPPRGAECGGGSDGGGQAAEPKRRRGRWRPVPVNATKARVQAALERWQNSADRECKTMPDEIPMVAPEVFSAWLRDGLCIPVDVREAHECECALRMQSAEPLTYMQLLMEPERAVPQVARLRRDGRRLVIISQHARRMDNCGLVAAVLVDVFGFSDGSIHRLEGGYTNWYDWLKRDGAGWSSAESHELRAGAEQNQASHSDLPGGSSGSSTMPARSGRSMGEESLAADTSRQSSSLLRPEHDKSTQSSTDAAPAMADSQKQADALLAAAGADLAAHEAAAGSLSTLVSGLWATEADARRCLEELAPLIARLDLDASLRSMLPKAALRPPAKRGPLDAMVLRELAARFARREEELRAAIDRGAAAGCPLGARAAEGAPAPG